MSTQPMREFGFMVMPGVGHRDGERCGASPCPLDATCRVFTSEERHPADDDLGVNIVCSFHALLYTSVWLEGLLRDDDAGEVEP